MEYYQDNYSVQDNEEEEGVALQGRQSRHPSQNNNDDDDATAVAVSIDENGNGNGDGSPISRSGSSTTSSDVDQSHSTNGTANEGDQKDGEEDNSTVHSSVFFYNLHGAQSIDGVSHLEVSGASYTVSEMDTNNMGVILEDSHNQNILTKETNHQSEEILDDEGLSGSISLKGSFAEQSIKSEPSDHAAITTENFEIIEEIDEEGTDFDVEKVLEKQNTHDLYCPYCDSCITRRVILHRRRRKIRTARRKPKQEKLEAIVHSEKAAHSTPSANDQRHDTVNINSDDGPAPVADDYNREREPADVFRCLSCLSFFIRTGDGFKLFPAFGDNKRSANEQDSQKIPASNRNWFLSIFRTDKRQTTIEQDGVPSAVLEGNADVLSQPGSDNSQPPLSDGVMVNNGQLAEDTLIKHYQGDHVVVTIEIGQEENAASQGVENIGGSEEDTSSLLRSGTRTDTPVGEQRDAGTGAANEWEVLKSIVYGGLTESITSLGVVTSAAGSGAATLNVLALGLANLIGGLFIIGHNLVDLKNDNHGETSSGPNQQEDRYRKTLGRRENFPLHVTLAILSFLIFGLLPPVIYGFSFRESGNRDLKLAAVAGASLVCIILLAIGKAHVQRQKCISTVFYYVSVGFMASGASFIAGDLLDMLLQKLGYSDSEPAVAVTLSSPTPKPFNLAWASY